MLQGPITPYLDIQGMPKPQLLLLCRQVILHHMEIGRNKKQSIHTPGLDASDLNKSSIELFWIKMAALGTMAVE